MITEEEKLRSEIIKIGGIAFMTPLGRVLYDPFELAINNGIFQSLVYFAYSLVLAYVGIIFISRSLDIMTERQGLKKND